MGFSRPPAVIPCARARARCKAKDESGGRGRSRTVQDDPESSTSSTAVREARQTVQLTDWSHDALAAGSQRAIVAQAYTLAGEEQLAIQQLDELLSRPSPVSVSLLRLDPLYDPLRDNPRFQALLAKYEN